MHDRGVSTYIRGVVQICFVRSNSFDKWKGQKGHKGTGIRYTVYGIRSTVYGIRYPALKFSGSVLVVRS